jgi:hypothetical protein
VIHPLQLASAMLVLVFATGLFLSMQVFGRQDLGKPRAVPAIQTPANPI